MEVIEKEKEVNEIKCLSKKPTCNQLEQKHYSLQVENGELKKVKENLTVEMVQKDQETPDLKRKLSDNHQICVKKIPIKLYLQKTKSNPNFYEKLFRTNRSVGKNAPIVH